ncbi:FAD-dependent pyridine nucleotide-disulfide oxidoreductase [Trematosphaeria pertusa]|uniref:FAD-dependent pyridine nucleotide-disulfide oxidoreductase n=1 Tax=Trematosphaeria pertusa TaxID=390896 RepID=A0A6A6IT65_9PLEO|nr:FAD-dependent pyridine nucleotide-disulfide oxidoreductase [Trematosphaeria pertusa]KAF2253684.1 FAD-dependent pyridine nucleotide-disulfide oxidoreductase [Trematosphaeria pertusa]
MATPSHYDTISIGSGEAGKYICWNRASTGKKTAVIEHKWLGGSCPNIACLPSKNVLYSADILHNSQKYASTGLLKVKGASGVDMSVVRERKRDMVNGLIEMHEGVFKNSGAELILGHGRLLDAKTVEVELKDGGKKLMTADNIIICTGSRAKIDNTPGLKEAKPLTHIEMLELDVVPTHLIILGGGYSGIEFAQAYRRFGAEVTVIERNERILRNEDEDVSSALVDILKGEGIVFHSSTSITSVRGTSGSSVTLTGAQNSQPLEISGSHLLVASGRVPNTEGNGLETVGVQLTPSGHVKVNEYLQTSVPGIFAVGDCAGSPHFTHISFDDFRIVRDFLNNPTSPPRSTKNRQVPYTLYTSPELAHVGLSEAAAKKAGIKYKLAKLPMTAFLRTRTMDATQGFAKALVSASDDAILGFTALGPRAGEMLPVVQLAMANALPYTSLSGLIITHPTMCEGLVSLFGAVPERT